MTQANNNQNKYQTASLPAVVSEQGDTKRPCAHVTAAVL
jgi:hypothetical protein